jgi:hypothetical protein
MDERLRSFERKTLLGFGGGTRVRRYSGASATEGPMKLAASIQEPAS